MSTSALQRARPAAALTSGLATAQLFAELNQNPIKPVVLVCPGSGRLEVKPFQVSASGTTTTVGAATTALATLYASVAFPTNPTVPASWTAIAVGTAAVINTTTAAWYLEAELLFDSTSGHLVGTFKNGVANVPIAAAALTAVLAGINGQNEPALLFAIGITFSAAGANVGNLADFSLNA